MDLSGEEKNAQLSNEKVKDRTRVIQGFLCSILDRDIFWHFSSTAFVVVVVVVVLLMDSKQSTSRLE